ncbi:uncharacterized protein [Engystomops pustulosus]|uniref:uncharacterized protein n=1 Tax=Engystomops pustulosus TaxID=76066 RepID=UPI003AFB78D8
MDFETAEGIHGCRNEIMHKKDLNLQEEDFNSDDDLSEDGQSRQKAEKRRAKKKRQRERKKLEKKKHLEENEQEPEWDVNSAFVANAASHIRPKSRNKHDKKHSANKENEEKGQEDDCTSTNPTVQRARDLAEQGINSVKDGNYTKAIELFSEAIRLDPKDYRYFGNRSYCYEQLELYPKALVDADVSIQLSADCPKGYFRKGRALKGCNRFAEAEDAFKMVLQLDEACQEALKEIHTCQVFQLMDQGFTEGQSFHLLEEYGSVAAVMDAPISIKVLRENMKLDEPGEEELLLLSELTQNCSLWVGNVTDQITEKQLWDLFKCYGEIHSIRVLAERFCAFVNFTCPIATARALEALQGKEVENTKLVIRYPDKPHRLLAASSSGAQSKAAAANTKKKVASKTRECFYWRLNGCRLGDKCCFRHVPENKGADRKPRKS